MKTSKPLTTGNLSRPILIFLSKDGVFQFARKNTTLQRDLLKLGYLPCASVATFSDAKGIQLATCKLSYDQSCYRFPIDGTINGLDRAGVTIEVLYLHWKEGLPGWPDKWGTD